MGNEQSGQSTSNSNQPTGVSSSFSFFNRTQSQRKSTLVVVNKANQSTFDPNDDEDLKRIKEIPRFYPILKGSIKGMQDSPEIYTKIDPKHIMRFMQRIQQHLTICSQTVATQQTSMYSKMVQNDQMLMSLVRKTSHDAKHFDLLASELKKVQEVNSELERIQLLFAEIVPSLDTLNDLLPEIERLPPLKLADDLSQRYPTIDHDINLSSLNGDDSTQENITITPEKYEYRVVDKD